MDLKSIKDLIKRLPKQNPRPKSIDTNFKFVSNMLALLSTKASSYFAKLFNWNFRNEKHKQII